MRSENILECQNQLFSDASELLTEAPILKFLDILGKVTQTGSSITGLMVYPDIDFTIQNENPNVQDAIDLVPIIFKDLSATMVKVTDFRLEDNEEASYYIGFDVPYKNKSWHIDATVTHPGSIITNPPELTEWINNMTEKQREIILTLKKELIDTKRYVGSKSKPPYTFRSAHLYEAVLKGNAKTIAETESYFS